jgi:HSP20 family protein
MSEVKVEKQNVPAPREASKSVMNDFFAPAFPSRFMGMSPFGIMRQFAEEMDRNFLGGNASQEGWYPAVDVRKANGNLVVTAELPGIRKEDMKVEVKDDALIIRGERKQEQEKEEGGYRRYERRYGSFYRAIPLPQGANSEQARAELNDGVLKISIPTPEPKANVRQIEVQSPSAKPAA